MKIFISADIEGVTGVTHWDETDLAHAENAAPARSTHSRYSTTLLIILSFYDSLCSQSTKES